MKINGQMHRLWRVVNHKVEMRENSVVKIRDKRAALAFMKKVAEVPRRTFKLAALWFVSGQMHQSQATLAAFPAEALWATA